MNILQIKNHAMSHEENRLRMCTLCGKKHTGSKNRMFEISSVLNKLIVSFVNNYDINDERLPKAICGTCKVRLYTAAKNKRNGLEFSITLPDYSHFKKCYITRSSGGKICNCSLCHSVRDVDHYNFNSTKKQNKCKKKYLCPECLSTNKVSVGGHKCYKSKLVQNLTNISSNLNPKAKEQLTCNLVKEISETSTSENSNSEKVLSLSQSRGKRMKIAINPSSSCQENIITADKVNKIAINCGLSTNKTVELTKCMRSALNNRKLFEPNLKEKLRSINHELDSFYDVKKCSFVRSQSSTTKVEEQPVVFCNNLDKLIEIVTNKRNSEENKNTMLKFTIDGGGGFLKICLSIQVASTEFESEVIKHSRKRLRDGIESKKFSDSGINKILLIALASNTEENYENVSILWNLLNIKKFEGYISTDIKLANILCGLMSSASCYPCTWCVAEKKSLYQCGELRKIGDILNNYEKWKKMEKRSLKLKSLKIVYLNL